jgi:hypothetical protein
MPPRRHSADLRGRRHDLGIGVRDMAAGLGVGLGRLLRMEDGTATDEDRVPVRLSRAPRAGMPCTRKGRDGHRAALAPNLLSGPRERHPGSLERVPVVSERRAHEAWDEARCRGRRREDQD